MLQHFFSVMGTEENLSYVFIKVQKIPENLLSLQLHRTQRERMRISYGAQKKTGTQAEGNKPVVHFMYLPVVVQHEQDFFWSAGVLDLHCNLQTWGGVLLFFSFFSSLLFPLVLSWGIPSLAHFTCSSPHGSTPF